MLISQYEGGSVKKYDVYGMGHALVDMEFEIDIKVLEKFEIRKGVMTLVDDIFQKKVIDSLQYCPKKMSCGGSAANTIMAVSTLGGKSFYSCKVADDENGNFYLQNLLANGIKTNLSRGLEPGVTGKCLVLITPDGERTMNTFLGITSTFSREQLVLEELIKSRYLYIGGYLLTCERAKDAIFEAVAKARDANVSIAVTLADPTVVSQYREDFFKILMGGIDLLFCNLDEGMMLCQTQTLRGTLEALKSMAHSFALTRGPKGAVVWDGGRQVEKVIPTECVQAIDTNGAGDLFAGSFLYGITTGKSCEDAGRFSCAAATKLVTQFGPRLERKELLKIKEEFFGEK